MKRIVFFFSLLFLFGAIAAACPQANSRIYFRSEQPNVNTAKPRSLLFVNETVTTHIVMPENIKLVDISTDKIAGNQCADNVVRIKPDTIMQDQEFLGTITLIGERNIALYDIIYTNSTKQAIPLFYVPQRDMRSYQNPSVSMPKKQMSEYAWTIFTSGRKFNNITTKANGLKMIVNNIYAVGDYFFLDFSIYNKTNIKYDIDEMRVKLMDKRETKATNSQTIELTPEYILFDIKEFRKSYRNVLVLKKLTFPEEKILQLEVYESQISGRTISISIAYEDILHADALSPAIITKLPNR